MDRWTLLALGHLRYSSLGLRLTTGTWTIVVGLFFAGSGCVTGGGETSQGLDQVGWNGSQSNYFWTQLGPDNEVLVRAVVQSDECPVLTVDGESQGLRLRQEPIERFPLRVCEGVVPEGSAEAKVAGKALALPPKDPKRIVILGDTGCRIKQGKEGVSVQPCHDPEGWPFALIAQSAAAEKPDLIIHLGDYLYREAPCPEGDSRCQGSAYGDTWRAWEQDFFAPVAPLLSQASWIFIRGNHELCSRGGLGWFRLLDPRPVEDDCNDQTAPYTVVLGRQLMAIVDSADGGNIQPSLDTVPSAPDSNLWVLTHRPFLTPPLAGQQRDVQVDIPPHLRGLGKISLVLAGHRHVMSLNQFRDERPPEFILGNSGTSLDLSPTDSDKIVSVGGSGFQGTGYFDFGYLTMDKNASGSWTLVEHDLRGKPVLRCDLREETWHKTVLTCDSHAYGKL